MKTKTRVVLSIIVAALCFAGLEGFRLVASPMRGAVTAAQFDDSLQSYAAANALRSDYVEHVFLAATAALLLLLWLGPFLRRTPRVRGPALIAILTMLGACSPYKTLDVVEVQSNETAWAIPLDALSNTGQVKFNSVDFLNQKKVPTKRIMVDKVSRSTGRMYWDIEWLPSVRVIKVDRSLVTRQWTDGAPGKHDDDYGIGVVTGDSVKLRVGLTITASIEEDDASTYLYYHGARPLAQVLDQNVRSFAVSELTKEYSNLTLQQAQTEGDEIYKRLFESAKLAFKAKGVTIQYLGNAEGLTYADPAVQQAINASYLAEQDVKTANQEQQAQITRNATMVKNAQAQSDAAQKLFSAKEAANFQNELSVKLITAQAQQTMATRWNGSMPLNVLPANSPLLMNLGQR